MYICMKTSMLVKKGSHKMKGIDKYIFACALALSIAGHAQDTRQNRRRQNMENVNPINDTLRMATLTHTVPLQQVNPPYIPKDSFIKYSNLNESVYLELQAFANATMNNVKCVFSPVVVIKPFIRFGNIFDVGVRTTQMVQNYITPNMSTITHDMYAYAKLRTQVGDVTLDVGKKSVLNYAGNYFSKSMPINNFFINAICFKSGHYYPRAIIAGFHNKEMAVQVGYAEEDSDGFKFTGNGAVVIATEAFIEDSFKGGLLLTMGKEKTVMDIQTMFNLSDRSALLLEVTNLAVGNQVGFHGTYRYSGAGGKINFFINGFKQTCDGVAGGTIGLRHTQSGTYVTIGATYHDPLRKTNPDGTPNDLYNKITPNVEFGIARGFTLSK